MSFILDALKKSENARQRQAGPALFEVKVAAPRRAIPLWAIIIGVLLAITAGELAWIVWHHGATQPRRAHPAAARALGTPTPEALQPAMPRTEVSSPPNASAASNRSRLAVVAPGPAQSPALTAPAPVSRPSPGVSAPPPSASSTSASSPRTGPDAADLAPAIEPTHSGNSPTGLPLYAQIVAAPGSDLPQLHLDLHVYDANPAKRFVMINMHKLHQGGALPDGVTVVKIRPDGVVLSYQGRKFLLPR